MMVLFLACAWMRAQEEDKARWRIQRTAPVMVSDLDSSALDLRMPDNIR